MNNKFFIVIGILLIGLFAGIWQYIETFKTESVSAVTVGIPNPGHSWSSMECSANTLCIDMTEGNEKIGIKTSTPEATLDVVGNIRASADICLTNGFCLKSIAIAGYCGSSNGVFATSAPTNNLCTQGVASSISGTGPWSWTCSGLNGGNSSSCATLFTCPSGATCTTVGADTVIKWTTVGSYTWTVPSGVTSVQYLVVGGGGGGGGRIGGGGAGGC